MTYTSKIGLINLLSIAAGAAVGKVVKDRTGSTGKAIGAGIGAFYGIEILALPTKIKAADEALGQVGEDLDKVSQQLDEGFQKMYDEVNLGVDPFITQ